MTQFIKPNQTGELLFCLLFSFAEADPWSRLDQPGRSASRCAEVRFVPSPSERRLPGSPSHARTRLAHLRHGQQTARTGKARRKAVSGHRQSDGNCARRGIGVNGPWYQSVPKDLSKPELRWYSWGFEGQALFVAKVGRLGAVPANLAVRGQACSDAICKNIDLTISVPLGGNTGKSDVRSQKSRSSSLDVRQRTVCRISGRVRYAENRGWSAG